MKYIIDAYAWIDYLEGGEKGEKVNNYLKEDYEIYISVLTISEVISKVMRKKGNVEIAYGALLSNAKIIGITPRIAKEAGLLHAEIRNTIPNFGLGDAYLLTISRKIDAKIITGDNHFKNFKEAILL